MMVLNSEWTLDEHLWLRHDYLLGWWAPSEAGDVISKRDVVEANPSQLWTWDAHVVSVHDGDTFTLDIVLWPDQPKLTLESESRLGLCNARELSEPGGTEAAGNLVTLLPIGSHVVARRVGRDKYGRILVMVTLDNGNDLTTVLIDNQWAAPWDGKGVKPVPPWPRTVSP